MAHTRFVRPTKFIKDVNQVHNLTHFICIPLLTSSSRPILEHSLGVLRESPASASIPSEAFIPPGMLQINLRIPMSLSTPSRFADAKKLLESLDLNSLTREPLKPSRRERSIHEQSLELEKSLSLSPVPNMTQPLPLHVTLSGISTKFLSNNTPNLAAQGHDPTSRVRHLRNNLAKIFAAAGLFDQSSLRAAFGKVYQPAVLLIRMDRRRDRSGKLIPSHTQPGTVKTYVPYFDCRELVRTFIEFVGADHLRLERMSLFAVGFSMRFDRADPDAQLSESCSVPL